MVFTKIIWIIGIYRDQKLCEYLEKYDGFEYHIMDDWSYTDSGYVLLLKYLKQHIEWVESKDVNRETKILFITSKIHPYKLAAQYHDKTNLPPLLDKIFKKQKPTDKFL